MEHIPFYEAIIIIFYKSYVCQHTFYKVFCLSVIIISIKNLIVRFSFYICLIIRLFKCGGFGDEYISILANQSSSLYKFFFGDLTPKKKSYRRCSTFMQHVNLVLDDVAQKFTCVITNIDCFVNSVYLPIFAATKCKSHKRKRKTGFVAFKGDKYLRKLNMLFIKKIFITVIQANVTVLRPSVPEFLKSTRYIF